MLLSKEASGLGWHLGMKVRLIRKLANLLDGIDVTGAGEGDTLDLPPRKAALLIAERWAAPMPSNGEIRAHSSGRLPHVATDRRPRAPADQLDRLSQQTALRHSAGSELRRAEDRIRDELHDERARIIGSESDVGLRGSKGSSGSRGSKGSAGSRGSRGSKGSA